MNDTTQTTNTLHEILNSISESIEFLKLASEIKRGSRVLSVSGLAALPARALVLTILQRAIAKPVAIAVEANNDLESLENDIRFWYSVLNGVEDNNENILTLPSFESDPYAGVSPHAEILEQRALTLWRITQRKPNFILIASQALTERIVTPDEIKQTGAILKRDEDFSLDELVERLFSCGYVREEPVNGVGQFSMRGGIVDVWTPDGENPYRIEFFGDTVDSIREFDADTQLSIGQLKEVSIAPMREVAATKQDFKDWSELARMRWNEERYARALKDRTQFADEGDSFNGWEWLMPLLKERRSSVFDYLKDALFVFDEPSAIEKNLSEFYATLEERFIETDDNDEPCLVREELFLSVEELRNKIDEQKRIELRALGRVAAVVDDSFAFETEKPSVHIGKARVKSKPLFLFPIVESLHEIEIKSRSARRYHNCVGELARDLKQERENRNATILVMQSHGMIERVAEMLREYDVQSYAFRRDEPLQNITSKGVTLNAALLTTGFLSSGFELPIAKLIVHVETDIFDESSIQDSRFKIQDSSFRKTKTKGQRPKTKSKVDAFLSDFRDLKPNDFVVHIDHGVARFGGLVTLELNNTGGEFMLLYYEGDAKLYVPVERLDLVQRYSSAEGHQPTLDKLGGIGWQKTKAKAKRAMRDMADELLRLYAERKLVQGFAFSSDTPWQNEFDDAFPYELTPDQSNAIEDVKKDMEAANPMDRLLCGDVGYGKTEVAMRAAFKAVMDGKQVVILSPTTVLAYQHYETFRSRFAAFPINIELLSRFRSAKEQKEVVKKTEAGAVDVVIGTHRLLSKDVAFKDLGLVVVDEEQRFGVAHKERLKHLKKKVDVLTLSATPIPRTLNMSLHGMRDMSIIETPPRDRLSINTQVVQFTETVITSAIEMELSRGGQVFFIHNRVETIDTIAALIKKLVPQARIVVAHGQMNEREMEEKMLDFVAHKFDVLVATTIIENGIDIPRANTIIINRADNYGLSQLYQLRGRVGRSNRRAYAYLLIPSERELTPIARRRLSAIREFSDLGAGFRIAALDLELRGAGNLLGGQQSGHLNALGFDLYMMMLERTINELRGEEIEDDVSVSINLGVDVAIPEDYIFEMGQRLRTYKRISSARDDDALRKIQNELQDRYGRVPESVLNLFGYARLRRIAEEVRVVSIDKTKDGFAIKLNEKSKASPESLLAFISKNEGATFTPNGALRVPFDEQNVLEKVRAVLLEIRLAD
jgi:transcription-repair coupling factor (superfamily II helicase)